MRFSLSALASATILSFMVAGCTPKETQALLAPSEALGKVLAEETAKAAGAKKQIILINPDASWGPTSLAEKAFKAALSKQGFSIASVKSVNVGDPMKSGQVGLKAADFLEALQKSPDAGAVVSFAGAPLLDKASAAGLPLQYPPVLVVATASLGDVPGIGNDRTLLAQMIEARLVQEAIIDGTEAASPTGGKPDADRELFGQHFQILRASDSGTR
ncbi:hypothetical protein [Pedosphaera parvula]|nr:hypothetical protein [Pedosphaera parvula]